MPRRPDGCDALARDVHARYTRSLEMNLGTRSSNKLTRIELRGPSVTQRVLAGGRRRSRRNPFSGERDWPRIVLGSHTASWGKAIRG